MLKTSRLFVEGRIIDPGENFTPARILEKGESGNN